MNKRVTSTMLLALATGTVQPTIDWKIFTQQAVPYTVGALGVIFGSWQWYCRSKSAQMSPGEVTKKWFKDTVDADLILDENNNAPKHFSYNGTGIDFQTNKTTFIPDHIRREGSTFEMKEGNTANPYLIIKAIKIIEEDPGVRLGALSHAQVVGEVSASFLKLSTPEANSTPIVHKHWRGGSQTYSIQNHWSLIPEQDKQRGIPRGFPSAQDVDRLLNGLPQAILIAGNK